MTCVTDEDAGKLDLLCIADSNMEQHSYCKKFDNFLKIHTYYLTQQSYSSTFIPEK